MTQNAEQQAVRFTLKQARFFRGQSQESMAEKLGIHRNTYAEWETHPEDISIKNAERISEILNMPIGSIFYRLGKFYNGPLPVNFKKGTLKLCSTRGKIFVYFKCWVLHLARDLTGSSGPISSCGQFAFYGTGLPNLFVFESAAKKKLCR